MNSDELIDDRDVYEIRQEKLVNLRAQGFNFPNHFRRSHQAAEVLQKYADMDAEQLAAHPINVTIAGRIVLRRLMGKASFFHLQDVSGRIQVYLRAQDVGDLYEQFKLWDLGDIVGVTGYLFVTKTGELTVHATALSLLTKSLRPLPDKFHGLADQETRYRKRYVDLIANEESRRVFLVRSLMIKTLRKFMDQHQFLEVETPMMHAIPGGAVARPFVTYHNALDRELFLRIAPELYLKRLVVGGFERVYEINRNFRNEGISTRHNPEFTMIEFYQAYADYIDLMNFTERLLQYLCDEVLQQRQIVYQDHVIDFNKPFARLTIQEAILQCHPTLSMEQIQTVSGCRAILDKMGFDYQPADEVDNMTN